MLSAGNSKATMDASMRFLLVQMVDFLPRAEMTGEYLYDHLMLQSL